jgi:hypothetical protein
MYVLQTRIVLHVYLIRNRSIHFDRPARGELSNELDDILYYCCENHILLLSTQTEMALSATHGGEYIVPSNLAGFRNLASSDR